MAVVRPFKGIRPAEGLASRIAALPYDVYNREEALEEVKKEPYSFLKIDRAETQFPSDVDSYDQKVYDKARETLHTMIRDGEFIIDEEASFYLYELTMEGRCQTGLVGCASIDDYINDVILKHENTRAEKEADRIRHVDNCNAQTGPIFLACHPNEKLSALLGSVKKEAPCYDFISEDGIGHRVWVIKDEERISSIENIFSGEDHLYIADGHHRCASAVKVGLKRREEHPAYSGKEEFNYFLSVIFAADELRIYDYNRVVKDLADMTVEGFLEKLTDVFTVEKADSAYHPKKKGELGMYLDTSWYKLTFREHVLSEDPVDGLDVSLLQKWVLEPMLAIGDPKTDSRIDFVGGIRGLKELERRVAEDCKVAFSMYPTSIGELFAVADAHRLMPPKSTWFEPKLRSGLFIHSLQDEA